MKKMFKTIISPMTHLRNLMSARFFKLTPLDQIMVYVFGGLGFVVILSIYMLFTI